jgi:hypothetical protein
MRFRYVALLILLINITLGSTPASADPIQLMATLTNAQENPPVVPTTSTGAPRPASYGSAFFTLNDPMTALVFTAVIFNIDFTGTQTIDTFDNLTSAHIHASPTVTPTTNAGVVFGFIGTPFNDTNPTDVVVTPFAAGVGGMVSAKWDAPEGNNTTLLAQVPNLLNNRAYLNFHTVQFATGEARGQITEMAPVPEPSTMLLVGFGVAGLIRNRWKARTH